MKSTLKNTIVLENEMIIISGHWGIQFFEKVNKQNKLAFLY